MHKIWLYQEHHDINFEHREQRRPLGLSADAVFRHYSNFRLPSCTLGSDTFLSHPNPLATYNYSREIAQMSEQFSNNIRIFKVPVNNQTHDEIRLAMTRYRNRGNERAYS